MILAFTGSGISKESGIPTFEDMGNLREKLSREYANNNPVEYQNALNILIEASKNATPNGAHNALAKYGIPVITMNIDGLHQKAGSKNVVCLHGDVSEPNKIVLYGDPAPNYQMAYDLVDLLRCGDIFLVVGASRYTSISEHLRLIALSNGARVVEIQDNASTKVDALLSNNKQSIEDFETFLNRCNEDKDDI